MPQNWISEESYCKYIIKKHLAGSISGRKKSIFRHTARFLAGYSAATACKKSFRMAKNGSFFVSDATGKVVTVIFNHNVCEKVKKC
jgi:hypothetical protein